MRIKIVFWGLICLLLIGGQVSVYAETEDRTSSISDEIKESISLDEIDDNLKKESENRIPFSISDYVERVCEGDCELSIDTIADYIKEGAVSQWDANKTLVFRLLLYAVLSGVFLNLTGSMYEKQLGENGFHMLYFLVVTILLSAFYAVFSVAKEVLWQVLSFMKALVPSYFAAAVFAGNSVGGLAFYESAILLIAAVQWVQRYLFLPGVQLYVLFLLLDHLSKDDRLSHLAELVSTVIEWAMKSMTAAAIGFQVIQGLILPAVDGLKNTAVSRTVSAIPGIGNLFGSVTDTVLGSAVLLKNAVGVCGMIAVLMLCLAPVCRLAFCTLIYKAMAALVQPVGDKRLNECVAAVAEGVGLLLKIMVSSSMLFFLTIAIVTASLGK